MASVKKNFLLSSAYQVFSVLVPIITTPYLSRVIGADGNGIFSFTQSVVNYFVLFAILGMSSYGVRAIAECGADRPKRSDVFWNAFFLICMTGFLVILAYIVYIIIWGRKFFLLYCIWGMWLLGSVLDVSWLFFGMQTFSVPTAGNFITRIVSVIGILVFVRSSSDVWAYVLAMAGSNLLNSIIPWLFVRRYVDFIRPKWSHMVVHLKPLLVLFVPVIAISIYSMLDKIMLGILTNTKEVGFFDYAQKISQLPLSIITALGSAVLPRMSQIMSQGHRRQGKKLVSITMWFMLACAFALSFGIVGIAPAFSPAFFGKGFDAVVPLMSVLAFVIPTICVTNVIGNQYMLPCHKDHQYTISVCAGAAVNVVANLISIPLFGAMGAAVSSVASELAVMLVQGWYVRHELDLRSYAKEASPFLIVGIFMAVALRALNATILSSLNVFMAVVVEFLIGVVLYLVPVTVWVLHHDKDKVIYLFPKAARLIQSR